MMKKKLKELIPKSYNNNSIIFVTALSQRINPRNVGKIFNLYKTFYPETYQKIINDKNFYQQHSMLSSAISRGCNAVVFLLLKENAANIVNQENEDGTKPAKLAYDSRNLLALELLGKSGADFNFEIIQSTDLKNSMLLNAVARDVKNDNTKTDSEIFYKTKEEKIKMIKTLLKYGANPYKVINEESENSTNIIDVRSAFFNAICLCRKDIVEIIVENSQYKIPESEYLLAINRCVNSWNNPAYNKQDLIDIVGIINKQAVKENTKTGEEVAEDFAGDFFRNLEEEPNPQNVSGAAAEATANRDVESALTK